VVAPLVEGLHPHGHTSLVQAQRLGKAVITTRGASVDDYVTHGREGLLVSPGDVAGYRQAILKMSQDHELRAACEQHAMAKAPELTYTAFAKRLTQLCLELLQ
jgi:glycosyltransferase involved in cell wall biosynthesis